MEFSSAVPAAVMIGSFPTGHYFMIMHTDLENAAFKECLMTENSMCRIGLNIALSGLHQLRHRYRIVVRSELPSEVCKTGN